MKVIPLRLRIVSDPIYKAIGRLRFSDRHIISLRVIDNEISIISIR